MNDILESIKRIEEAKKKMSPLFELCRPARCTDKLPEDLSKPSLIGEEKLDGSRYVLYLGVNPYKSKSLNPLLSRRESVIDFKFLDKSENVPQITDCNYENLKGTVLDGEVFNRELGFNKSSGILNSNPRKAQATQVKDGVLTYYAFDIMFYKGVDVRPKPYHERRAILEHVVELMNNDYVKVVRQFDDIEKGFNEIMKEKGEGLVIKNIHAPYGISWSKMKKVHDVSCIVMGMNQDPKSKNTYFKSLSIGVYTDDGSIQEIGDVAVARPDIRKKIFENWPEYFEMPIDVFAMELSKKERLRHTSFKCFRGDINPEDCTLGKVKEDFRTNRSVKWKRE